MFRLQMWPRPAQAHEEGVVALSAKLDSSEESQRSVLFDRVAEGHHVEVFHGDPPEYGPVVVALCLLEPASRRTFFKITWFLYLHSTCSFSQSEINLQKPLCPLYV